MNAFRILLLLVGLVYGAEAIGQTNPDVVQVDSAMQNPDLRKGRRRDTTTRAEPPRSSVVKDSARLALEAMPRKAAIRSAIIPGWGQVTNRRIWKVPFVYAGLIGAGLGIEFNQRYYLEILTEARFRYNNPNQKQNPKYDRVEGIEALNDYKNFYRRNRDLCFLLGAAAYAVNVIDAYVDAKLFRWDIGDDLGFSIAPTLQPVPSHAYNVPVPAVKIRLNL
jgi:hypothetical protein